MHRSSKSTVCEPGCKCHGRPRTFARIDDAQPKKPLAIYSTQLSQLEAQKKMRTNDKCELIERNSSVEWQNLEASLIKKLAKLNQNLSEQNFRTCF